MRSEIEATLAKWVEAYGRQDPAALAALYTPDALFFGGSGGLYRGQDGARAYFSAMPTRIKPSMAFRDVTLMPLGEDAVNVAMIGAAGAEGADPRDVRFSQTHVRTPDGWRIASHHGSVG